MIFSFASTELNPAMVSHHQVLVETIIEACEYRLKSSEQIGYFNLAVYWKRGYRGKQTTDPWYLLTSLSDLNLTLKLYRQRWGIETMFKDYKTGGYNLEQACVNQDRFLALFLLVVLAYGMALLAGASLTHRSLKDYLVRTYPETRRKYGRFNDFSLGLTRYGLIHSASILEELGQHLMATKPHKRLYFQRGLAALSSLQLSFSLPCHP